MKDHSPGATALNAILVATRRLRRKILKKWNAYWRSLVETKLRCFKLPGARVMARHFNRQFAERQVRAAILDRLVCVTLDTLQGMVTSVCAEPDLASTPIRGLIRKH